MAASDAASEAEVADAPDAPAPRRLPRGVGTLQWASDEAFNTAALEQHKQAFDVVWHHFRSFRGRFPLDGYLHYIREDPARWLSLLPPPYRDPKGHMRKAVSAIYALQRSTPLRQVPDLPEAVGATVLVLRAAFKAAKSGQAYVPGLPAAGGAPSETLEAPDTEEEPADAVDASLRDLVAMLDVLEAVSSSPDATAAALTRIALPRARRALADVRAALRPSA